MWHLYTHPRLLLLWPLGLASGLPLALIASTLAIWLTEAGVDKSTIGLFALTGLPYTLKFLWAPWIDHVRLPGLSRWLGRRRSWMVATQISVMLALLVMGWIPPDQQPLLTAVAALLTAFCSASQDIVLDAYRIEILQPHQYGAGAATFVFGYRLGMLISGAGALYLATSLGWSATYAIMAATMIIGLIASWYGPEPPEPPLQQAGPSMDTMIVQPLRNLIQRSGWVWMVLLILCYKLGDALAGVMTAPLLVDLGFSKVEIANVTKLFGLAATLLGSMLGGWLVHRSGVVAAMLWCGVAQMGSNLMFTLLAWTGRDSELLVMTIAIENLTGGMGSAALVAYLSSLCHTAYTATQYALLSSLTAFGRTVLASSAGLLVEWLGWPLFFILTTIAALPGVLILVVLMRQTPNDHPSVP
ncbi:MAG: AmpG family muropeptide MFS transporter [Magnetococcales bacterium]|nr:AmpG family muropeptide MFS transporter [Magnetococcales bacterium]